MIPLFSGILDHFRQNWSSHVAAGTASFFSIINQLNILNAIVVGVNVYVITQIIRWGTHKIISKMKKKP